jgi:hypothetical protein
MGIVNPTFAYTDPHLLRDMDIGHPAHPTPPGNDRHDNNVPGEITIPA